MSFKKLGLRKQKEDDERRLRANGTLMLPQRRYAYKMSGDKRERKRERERA